MTEILSIALVQSNRTLFCNLLSLLVVELEGVAILTPPPRRGWLRPPHGRGLTGIKLSDNIEAIISQCAEDAVLFLENTSCSLEGALQELKTLD